MTIEEFKTVILSITPDENGCLVWPYSKNDKGYGRAWVYGKRSRTNRLVYEAFIGPIPSGLSVLHKCPNGENRSCVNPDHLKAGTQAENVDDCIKSGKHKSLNPFFGFGSKNPSAKLNISLVEKIRSFKGIKNATLLAREFSVSRGCIRKILSGKTWAS